MAAGAAGAARAAGKEARSPRKGGKAVARAGGGGGGGERKVGAGGGKAGPGGLVCKGVAQHKTTRRWEAHIWHVRKQVYVGSFHTQEEAARAYDRCAIHMDKDTSRLNFPFEDYADEAEELRGLERQELLSRLRRKSIGFTRGRTNLRGVSWRPHSGRWEARISGVQDGRYTYLGTYDTCEEAAEAYDRAAIALKGADAVTNYEPSRYQGDLGALSAAPAGILGKNRAATLMAVTEGREKYYADIAARGGKRGSPHTPQLPGTAVSKKEAAGAADAPRGGNKGGITRQEGRVGLPRVRATAKTMPQGIQRANPRPSGGRQAPKNPGRVRPSKRERSLKSISADQKDTKAFHLSLSGSLPGTWPGIPPLPPSVQGAALGENLHFHGGLDDLPLLSERHSNLPSPTVEWQPLDPLEDDLLALAMEPFPVQKGAAGVEYAELPPTKEGEIRRSRGSDHSSASLQLLHEGLQADHGEGEVGLLPAPECPEKTSGGLPGFKNVRSTELHNILDNLLQEDAEDDILEHALPPPSGAWASSGAARPLKPAIEETLSAILRNMSIEGIHL